ncbi:MAG: hypothetical protein WBS33_12890 [Verrucomicrobiia bacterium]
MKSKPLLGLALVLGSAMTTLAQGEQSPLFRVVAIPSLKSVHTNESLSIALRVENLAKTNQLLHTGSQDSQWDWQVDNPDICLTYGPVPTANFPIVINIPPGGEYTNEMGAAICKPISAKTLTFRMGFTPRGDKQTFWSNKVLIKIIP